MINSHFDSWSPDSKASILSRVGGVTWKKDGYYRVYFNVDTLVEIFGFCKGESLLFATDKECFIKSRSEWHYDLMWVFHNCKVYYDLIQSRWVVMNCPFDKRAYKNYIIDTIVRLSEEEFICIHDDKYLEYYPYGIGR